MQFSRRKFLETAAVLAAASPLISRNSRGDGPVPVEDAVAMALAVREGRTTQLALVDQAIARLEKANPWITAVSLPNYERAREQARIGMSGPLAGVPTLVKDNEDQKGLPNTHSSRLLLKHVASTDTPYIQAIERAGLISIGRSNLPEFAGNATTESALRGPTRNPWNPDYTAGGSSGGSAAAVAAGVVPVAHGNDLGGSIRHAAAPCGLVGLKPSRGRNVNDGRVDSNVYLVQGCVSRTVRDTAAWLAATEASGSDAPRPPVGVVSECLTRALRIGAHSGITRTNGKAAPEVLRVFSSSIALMERLGHKVRAQSLAFDGRRATAAFVTLLEAQVAHALRPIEKGVGHPLTTDDVEPATLGAMVDGLKVTDAGLAEENVILADMAARYTAQFGDIDIYMTPTLSTEPVKIGVLGPAQTWAQRSAILVDYACYCWLDNVSGTPAITLPMGFSDAGLPVGIQFATRLGGERLLLELAFQLENAVGWADRRPPLWVA